MRLLTIALLVFPGILTLFLHLGIARGEEFTLKASRRTGNSARVELLLEVAGDLKVVQDSQTKAVPLKVVGSAAYEEVLLGLPDTLAGTAKSARKYQKLEAEFQIDDQRHDTLLRDGRRAIGVAVREGESTYWSPAGPLSREELDLIDVQGSSLLVDGLLPDKAVSIDSTWQPPDAVLVALLGLDAISASSVTGVLKEVTPEAARFELSGSVQGAIGGVSSDIELKAKCKFDRAAGRITWFALLIKEQRSIGHVGPGIDAVARLQLKIVPTDEPDADLLAVAQAVRDSSADDSLELGYRSPTGRFQFLHDRLWHVVNDEPDLVVLRRVDRGELVAQANITPLAPAAAEKAITLAKFQEDVKKALGDTFGQFANASEQTNPEGRRIYRVVATGKVSDLPVEWHYYLVMDDQGRQVSLVFTLEQSLVDKLGDSDRQLAETVECIDPPVESARVPARAAN